MPGSPSRELAFPLPVLLVVDDDEAVRNSLNFALQLEGFVMRLYNSGEELLNDADLPEIGCLLIDYYMPGMTGLELVTELRRRNVNLPALLITGHPSVAVRRQATEAGIRLLEKPLLGNVLVEAIYDAVQIR